MDYDDLVEKFNNNDLDVVKYFNDYPTFFSILKKRGLMSEIDPHNASDSEEWQNEYLLWLYHNDKEAFYKWVPTLLTDVEIKDGVPYLDIEDRSELGVLFCSGRNDISQDTITNVLAGESDWEPYWDTTDDVYRDVVDELNEDNLKYLGEYIVSHLEGQTIEPETELLSEIASSQGSDNPTINFENVIQVIKDEETLTYLWGNNLQDLKSELYSIHSNAYNSAYEDEIYEAIWSELNTYFIGKGEWVSRPHRYKKNTEVQNFVIPIANFDSYVVDYLSDNKGYGNSGTLEYVGSYIGMLKEWLDCLSVHPPDYPDFRKVDRNINEYFKDYL